MSTSKSAPMLHKVSPATSKSLERLLDHQAEPSDLSNLPVSRLAAVLVLLYEKDDQLRVLLTTRSKRLRTHAGQTALPGGRMDETDKDYSHTALREAFEEVGLPLNSPHIHILCLLRPFISLNRLWVTPVVSFLDDPQILDHLKPSPEEVDHIFTHLLAAFLDPGLAKGEPLVDIGTDDWPYEVELHSTTDSSIPWLEGSTYRMQRFRSSASPIKGLTADIMIHVASIAYDKDPLYERYAPNQLRDFASTWSALREARIEA